MSTSFGARLKSHRERRGIALAAIAQSTKISVAVFEALERDDTSRWPAGIFRRSFVRAYAGAVGLDPESTLAEFVERFPDPYEERRAGVAGPSRAGTALRSRGVDVEPLRLTLADQPRFPAGAYLEALHMPWRRAAVAACDLAIAIAIASAVFAAVGAFWTPFALVTAGYYFSGMLIAGTSPAACLFGRVQNKSAAYRDAVTSKSTATDGETDRLTPFSPRYPRAV